MTGEIKSTRNILKRELFISFAIYYFPLVILMSIVVLSVDFLKQNIAFYYPILCLLFPALVSVAMAIVRIRIVWGIKQIPELKLTAAFLSIVFLMLLIEKLIYSVFVTPDLLGAIFYLLAFLLSTLWFKMQKEALRKGTFLKLLVLASTFFMFIWIVLFALFRSVLITL
jgi:hypothetical protein